MKQPGAFQVVKKTQQLAIGRQEAETEVFIDKIVSKLGGQEQALLYVTSEIASETRVCTITIQDFLKL